MMTFGLDSNFKLIVMLEFVEYEGATLMHCELHPSIVYTQFSSVLRKQKEIIKELISQRQQDIQKIHPGLTCFKEGKCIFVGSF